MAETFGQKLQGWRERADIQQAELARRVGVSRAYISNLERDFSPSSKGRPQPSVELCDKIARALGAPVAEVRLAAGYAPPAMNGEVPVVPEEEELLFYFRGMAADRRADVLAITQTLHARSKTDGEKAKMASVIEDLIKQKEERTAPAAKNMQPIDNQDSSGAEGAPSKKKNKTQGIIVSDAAPDPQPGRPPASLEQRIKKISNAKVVAKGKPIKG
ncbi:MAG TPA: helix-turn-helix domain-containing protein [Blastocatellia bacterium]|nr:helix-turn-helix domain-containing protein [Blastocatellia bacterium]